MSLSRRTLLSTSAACTAATAFGLTACQNSELSHTGPKATNIEKLLQSATDLMVNSYPETASSSGIDKGDYAPLKAKLTDRTASGQASIEAEVRAMTAKLKSVDVGALSVEQAGNVGVIRTVFETASEGFDFKFGDNALLNTNWSYRPSPYVVAQNTGAFVEIPSFLDASHSLSSQEDAEAYLSRLVAYADQLDGETERTREASEKGVILPDFLLAKTLGQLRGARERAPAEWGLVSGFVNKTQSIGDYAARAEAIASEKIGPAIDRQIAAHEGLVSRANSDAGVWAKPEGEAYYDWALRASTTTTMSADEVHQMGLDELASLQARMEPILQSIGYTQGTVGERMSALGADKRYHFSDGDKGRAEIMSFIEDAVEDIRGRMPQAFETLVPGFLEVTRIDPEVEAGAPGAYGGAGSIDGTKPGHFWINLRTPALHNKFGLADLTYHEAIPGHVWQGEYTFKQPLIRSLLAFNAYSEGWALYAQQLADELGVYDDFPVGRLGYLQSLAFRACRLVVDTGLHSKRWTREQANEWFVTNNGSNPDEVRGEIDRYCAWPGQACGYKVGHSAINNLRQNAQAKLGDKFNFRRFNDALVLGGSVPMTVLGDVIDDYIAKESA